LQFELRLSTGPLRGRQQQLVEVAGVQRVAERSGAIGVADDRLAQLEAGLAQPPRSALGAGQRIRPAGGEVDRIVTVARRQRRDQQRVGGCPVAGVPSQGTHQLRVLGGAGGDYKRLLVFVHLHLSLLWGRWLERPFVEALLHPAPRR
jgi:hypothetical protein